jgi:SNF2 family DNA or RNA helicase
MARAARDSINKELAELNREYSEKLQAINARKEEVESLIWKDDSAYRQAERLVKSAEQELRDAIRRQQAKDEFDRKVIKFEDITSGLSWREWALEHQIDGAKFLASAGRGILADKMGLGKTLTSLITADMLQSQKLLVVVPDDVASNFVSEIVHWAPHRHAIMIGKRPKDQRDMLFNILLPSMNEYTAVINYSAWRKDKSILTSLIDCRFDMVIMDEAHTIKNARTAAFKGCEQIVLAENSCPECRGRIQPVHDDSEFVQSASRYTLPKRDYMKCIGENKTSSQRLDIEIVKDFGCGWSEQTDIQNNIKREFGDTQSVRNLITMTGTPILNKPTDIFAMLRLIDPITYEKESDFIYNYCARDYNNKIVFRPGGMESLVKRLSNLYIGRDRKSAGVVLPKQEVIIHDLPFDKVKYSDQYRVIKQLTKHATILLSSGKALPIPAIIALITRKRQANVWPAGIEIKDPETGLVVFSVSEDVNESMKLDAILERPQTSESGEWEGLGWEITGEGSRQDGERLVIFSQFKTPLAELEKRFRSAGVDVVRFDGDTPEEIRQQVKIDFDRKFTDGDDYKWQVVLCNYKTGGVGLNFTAATQMIMLDEEWNPGKRDQAYGRVDRIGQTEETTVHVLRQESSIDSWLASLINDKENMINDFEAGASLQSAFADFLKKED